VIASTVWVLYDMLRAPKAEESDLGACFSNHVVVGVGIAQLRLK
jgi:hypothetical protein